MLKKTVTYEDFDGNERTETAYFNLTQIEVIEMAMELPEGVSETVGNDPSKVNEVEAAQKLVEKIGNKGILDFLKTLLLKSYGIKSEDGRKFEKSDEISREFSQTLVYDAILMEFMQDDKAAAEFVNKVIPAQMLNKVHAQIGNNVPGLTLNK